MLRPRIALAQRARRAGLAPAALGSALALAAALAAGCGGQADPNHWRFALEEVRGSVQHAYATRFAERIEAATDGAVRMTVYPYGALGTSAQLTELVETGAVELAFASPGHLGSVVPEVQVFSLHFVLSDEEAVNHAVLSEESRVHEILRAAYREHGLELLAPIQEGWMAWTANRALRAPADFQGLKIRTMASPLLIDVYEAYGANPTPMPYSEVYSGLQLGMIDAQVNPVFAIEEMSFYEVQSHLVLPKHLPFITTLITSPAFLERLSPERRETFHRVERAMRDEIFRIQSELNRDRLRTIRTESDTRILELDDAERAAFRRASLPVRERFRSRTGERGSALLDALLARVEEVEAARAEAGSASR